MSYSNLSISNKKLMYFVFTFKTFKKCFIFYLHLFNMLISHLFLSLLSDILSVDWSINGVELIFAMTVECIYSTVCRVQYWGKKKYITLKSE